MVGGHAAAGRLSIKDTLRGLRTPRFSLASSTFPARRSSALGDCPTKLDAKGTPTDLRAITGSAA